MGFALLEQVPHIQMRLFRRFLAGPQHGFQLAPGAFGIAGEIDLHGMARPVETRAELQGRLLDNRLVFRVADDLPAAFDPQQADQGAILGDQGHLVIGGFQTHEGFDRLSQHRKQGRGQVLKPLHAALLSSSAGAKAWPGAAVASAIWLLT